MGKVRFLSVLAVWCLACSSGLDGSTGGSATGGSPAAGASGSGTGGAGNTTTSGLGGIDPTSTTFSSRIAWARSVVSAPTASSFSGVAADGSGSVFVTGNLSGPGSLDFGNGLTATAVSDGDTALLMRYDASGTPQWVQTVAAGSAHSEFYSPVVDSAGALYVSCYLNGSPGPVDFGNGVTFTRSDTFGTAVLVKYDSSGLAQWAQAATGGGADAIFEALAVDAAGGIYAVGNLGGTGTYDFGNGVTATGVATADGFVTPPSTAALVRYDSSGVAQWAKTIVAGSPVSSFNSVAVNAAGDIYAAGSIGATTTYDFGNGVTLVGTASGGPLASEAGSSAILVRYDSSGVAQWGRAVNAAWGNSGFDSVALDSAGNVYAAGFMADSTYDFGNGVTAAGSVSGGSFTGTVGPQYLVLAKYSPSGSAQWARTVNPGGSNSYLNSVVVDASDNVYIAGAVLSTGTYDFGNGVSIPTAAQGQGYYAALVKYDASGLAQWAQSSRNGGGSSDILTALTLDSAGDIYAAGVIAGPGNVAFGNDVTLVGAAVTAFPGWSSLLVKYQ